MSHSYAEGSFLNYSKFKLFENVPFSLQDLYDLPHSNQFRALAPLP